MKVPVKLVPVVPKLQGDVPPVVRSLSVHELVGGKVGTGPAEAAFENSAAVKASEARAKREPIFKISQK